MNDHDKAASSSSTSDAAFNIEGRAKPAGSGLDWWTNAWPLFTRQPLMWVLLAVVMIIGTVVAMFIPFIGHMAIMLLSPVIAGGLMLGAREVDRGEALSFNHLIAGFSANAAQLFLVGVISLVGMIVAAGAAIIFATGFGIGVSTLIKGISGGGDPAMMGVAGAVMLSVLIAFAFLLPVYMAIWFAPALIVLHGTDAVDAMKASFFGCLKNIVPFLVYGVVGMLLAIVAAIPFGLGLLVLGPVTVVSVYVGYRDIYLGG